MLDPQQKQLQHPRQQFALPVNNTPESRVRLQHAARGRVKLSADLWLAAAHDAYPEANPAVTLTPALMLAQTPHVSSVRHLPAQVDAAAKQILDLMEPGDDAVREERKRAQLRELALLNGTVRVRKPNFSSNLTLT